MIVYVVTNKINGKKYVGQTIQSLDDRRRAHETYARCPESKSHYAFQAAIAKYGPESFDWVIVFESNDPLQITEKEIEMIEALETYGIKGYNLTRGGLGSNKGGPVEVICSGCNQPFWVQRGKYNQNVKVGLKFTCSNECRKRWMSIRNSGNGNPRYIHGQEVGRTKRYVPKL